MFPKRKDIRQAADKGKVLGRDKLTWGLLEIASGIQKWVDNQLVKAVSAVRVGIFSMTISFVGVPYRIWNDIVNALTGWILFNILNIEK